MYYCTFCERGKIAEDLTTDSTCTYPICWDCRADEEESRLAQLKKIVVAVWLVGRAYGGPEEEADGWWYDEGQLEFSIEVNDPEAARLLREALRHEYDTTTRNRYSVIGRPDYVISIHERDAEYDEHQFDCRGALIEYFPVRRPQYS